MPSTQPVTHLTFAESSVLRRRLESAITDARELFIQDAIVREMGVVVSGPDPRAVDAEVLLVLARVLARQGLDVTGAALFEAKIDRLEVALATALVGYPGKVP